MLKSNGGTFVVAGQAAYVQEGSKERNKMGPQTELIRAVNLALAATLILSALKLGVALATNSVGLFSEAIHSFLDLLSSTLTRIVVGLSERPADEERPFGYGKLQNLSALFEAFLLLIAGVYIIYEGLSKIHAGSKIQNVHWAMGVTVLSMVVNLYVYFQNRGVARAAESIAIETNAYHFLTDFFSSAALLIGLAIIDYTRWDIIDPIAAILIAAYIFWVAMAQIK